MLNPLGDRVIIRRDEEEEKTEGGLFIPDTAKQPPIEATVIAIGPGFRCPDNGIFIETTLKPGQRVMAGPHAGIEVSIDVEDGNGKMKHILLREGEILGTLDGNSEEKKAEARKTHETS